MSLLSDTSTKILITTSPTGLGHIRVTKALIDGLPTNIKPEIIGINDQTVSTLYRMICTNPYMRKSFEFLQTNPQAEKFMTDLVNYSQNRNIEHFQKELDEILKKSPQTKSLIIVSTHAQLAQKVSILIKTKKIPLPTLHAVIVTDDSPQRMWMADCDLLFVPSHNTKDALLKLYEQDKRPAPKIIVNPYPINPNYAHPLSAEVIYNKIEQLDPKNPQHTRIALPISGAAVQLDYHTELLEYLTNEKRKHRILFSVVTREGTYTKPFINHFRENPNITFHIGANDLQTVELYDRLYFQLNPPALEITKPSEQSFKVLTTPSTIGGPILLFTHPVGRQEYDNINYLQRNHFLPEKKMHLELVHALLENNAKKISYLRQIASKWRALQLPEDPKEAGEFIIHCLKNQIFQTMQKYIPYDMNDELSPYGVKKNLEDYRRIFKQNKLLKTSSSSL